jgi:tRNA A37 threonylcarbamoyladenosine synthetase subunit TsaC/SUA5/YrdC
VLKFSRHASVASCRALDSSSASAVASIDSLISIHPIFHSTSANLDDRSSPEAASEAMFKYKANLALVQASSQSKRGYKSRAVSPLSSLAL